jgi:coatomer protein complex subunit epsilon
MDPFSAEGGNIPLSMQGPTAIQSNSKQLTPIPELLNIHNAFHQAQYQNVIDFDVSALSSENALPARVLKLRARVALGQTEDMLSDIADEADDVPDLAAVKALALQAAGNEDDALALAEDLAASYPENATVQVLGGTVLQAQGKSEEALSLLEKHQGNLEA